MGRSKNQNRHLGIAEVKRTDRDRPISGNVTLKHGKPVKEHQPDIAEQTDSADDHNDLSSQFHRKPNDRSQRRGRLATLGICHRTIRTARPLISTHFRLTNGYPTTPKTIGEFLRQKRMDSGCGQMQVAQQLGVSLATVFKWEHNKTRPPAKLRQRIVEFLGFDPESK